MGIKTTTTTNLTKLAPEERLKANQDEPFTVNVTWGDMQMEQPLAVTVEARDELEARRTIHRFISHGAYKAKLEPYVEKKAVRVEKKTYVRTNATSMDDPRIAKAVEANPDRAKRRNRQHHAANHLLAAAHQLQTLVNIHDPNELARQLDQAINSIAVGVRTLKGEK